MTKDVVELLLVEDNSSDEELTLHVLKKYNLANRIRWCAMGLRRWSFYLATAGGKSPS